MWYRRFSGGKELGGYMFPPDPYEEEEEDEDPYILYNDVLGETEPIHILRKLGVAKLLGFN